MNRNVVESVGEALGDKMFKSIIRQNVTLAEAPAEGLDVFRYNDKSNGAKDYTALTAEILSTLEN